MRSTRHHDDRCSGHRGDPRFTMDMGPDLDHGFRPRGPRRRGGRGFMGPDGPRLGMRARRGQLRDSILRLLVDTPANGYQLMTELSEKTFGVWKPSPGATYPCLSQLEDEGLITATTVDGQKVFTLTDAGRVAAAQVADEPWADARRGPDSAGHQQGLFEQFGNLAVTVRFAGQTGTDEQLAAIAQQLDTTRKAILAIMAEQ